ncbi:MAG: hypothetical protein QOG65_3836 [Actinomycetota bacterium]|nr:hypothetical protein [Actinomycetota bacterium]
MLTRRGWSFVGAAVGLFVGARMLGLVQLAVLSIATVLLLIGAYVWVRAKSPALEAHRTLKELLQVGVEGRVDLTVSAIRRSPTIAVADAFDHGRRAARFLLAPLGEAEEARAAYRFPTDRRGRFEIGPLRATLTDPFGLVSSGRRVLGTEQVIVYPQVHEIVPPPDVGGLDLDRDHPAVKARVESSGDFMTLREYAPGDDLRHVHWRSTARRGHLMMRQNETRRRAPVLLMLDVRPATHDRASFERAVEAVASIATALDRAGRPFEVAWSTGMAVGAPGRRHLAHIMDELAIVEPHGADRLLIASTRRRSSALIAVTGRLLAPDAASLGMLVRDGGLLVTVPSEADSGAVAPRARRFRSLVVPYDERPFAHSWNEAVLRWQRTGSLPTSSSPAPS